MKNDVDSILGVKKRDKKAEAKSKQKKEKKRPEGVNREVFSLTNGVPPLMGTQDALNAKKGKKRALNWKVDKWVWTPFPNSARGDTLKLKHWQKDKNKDEVYSFSKLNQKIALIKFNDEEYEKFLKDLSDDWTKEETEYLWKMLEQFDLRFVVIHDRYDKEYQRTVEELKDRYYSCSKVLLEERKEEEHSIVKKPFNYDYEVKRKYFLEKLYMRTKHQNDKEKHIIDYIKKLDQKLKKYEREEKNLAKILDDDKQGTLLRRQEEEPKGDKKEGVAGAYLRSQNILAPVPMSEKGQNQMEIILKEMEIVPEQLKPTEKVLEVYIEIKKEIIRMLQLHKHIKKRKEEISILDYKIKDMEDFCKISEMNKGPGGPRGAGGMRYPPPQIGQDNVPPSLGRSASGAVAEKPHPGRASSQKSPNKDVKSAKGGKKRKAAGGGAANKRARN